MNARHTTTALTASIFLALTAWGSDAETSATAGTRVGAPGDAAATARYEGDVGFARTDTRSGQVNLARGVAVGVDENGVSLSLSSALAPRFGPAVATNFNISIGRDGHGSASIGTAVARGGAEREVTAGGATTTHGAGTSLSMAGGRTLGGGQVVAHTESRNSGPRPYPDVRTTRPVERAPVIVARPGVRSSESERRVVQTKVVRRIAQRLVRGR